MRALEVLDLLVESNVFNVDAVGDYCATFASRVQSPQGKKFFTRNVRRWLLSQPEHHRPLRRAPADAPPWAQQAAQQGDLVEFQPSDELQDHLDHLADFIEEVATARPELLQRIERLDPPAVANLAGEFYRRQMLDNPAAQEEVGTALVKSYPDGSRWVDIQTQECLKREGRQMGHCVAMHWSRLASGEETVLSLRGRNNEPHATVAIRGPNKEVIEAKGKQNKPVIGKYAARLVDLLNLIKATGYPNDLRHSDIIIKNGRYKLFDITELEPIQFSFGQAYYEPSLGRLWLKTERAQYAFAVHGGSNVIDRHGRLKATFAISPVGTVSDYPLGVIHLLPEVANRLHLEIGAALVDNSDVYKEDGTWKIASDFAKLPSRRFGDVTVYGSFDHNGKIWVQRGDETIRMTRNSYGLYTDRVPDWLAPHLVDLTKSFNVKISNTIALQAMPALPMAERARLADHLDLNDRVREALLGMGLAWSRKEKRFIYGEPGTVPAVSVKGSFTPGEDITTLSPGTKIGGTLHLSRSNITELPDNLTVARDLALAGSKVKKLGNNTWVKRVLDLRRSQVEQLPSGLKVGGKSGGRLDLRNSKITRVPDDLEMIETPPTKGYWNRRAAGGAIVVNKDIEVPERLKPLVQRKK